jgi:hypothetical protein
MCIKIYKLIDTYYKAQLYLTRSPVEARYGQEKKIKEDYNYIL